MPGPSGNPLLPLLIKRDLEGSREQKEQKKKPFQCFPLCFVACASRGTPCCCILEPEKEVWWMNTWGWLLGRKQRVQPWGNQQTMLVQLGWRSHNMQLLSLEVYSRPVSAESHSPLTTTRADLPSRNKQKPPRSTPTMLFIIYNLLWLLTEDYLEELLATFMRNKKK